MQHYEAPTRLQDWTYSFYVALLFAVDRASPESSRTCTVWAANAEWFRGRFQAMYPALHRVIDKDRNFRLRRHTFRRVFRQEKPFVLPVNADRLNERLIKQQGLFLCPGAVCRPFEDNIRAMQRQKSGTAFPDAWRNLVRFEISTAPKTRTEILRELQRMNISTATIYPGIQGFARSLENLLVFPDILEYGPKYDDDFLL